MALRISPQSYSPVKFSGASSALSIPERVFPLTSRLIPFDHQGFNPGNLKYIILNTALSRFIVALARCYQNIPSINRHHDYTPTEKRHAFMERVNMEIIGTIGFTLSTNMGSDVAAKLFESRLKALPQFDAAKEKHAGLSEKQIETINAAIRKVYGETVSPGVHQATKARVIARGIFDGANLKNLEKVLDLQGLSPKKLPALQTRIWPEMEKFAAHVNLFGSLSLLVGVVTGALFAGYVMQTFNDSLYRKHVIPWLEKIKVGDHA